ncbi:hypothetical protein WMF37_39770 [Sorangium sp. So ce291]|uniref:hypothetical protein n=1 Tax=Sorangium sp. So ce291 TaxID=3133294 RepID=UPI003F5E2FFD
MPDPAGLASSRPRRASASVSPSRFVAEGAPALDAFPTRPWNRKRLWTAVLDALSDPETEADREAFQQALGAIQALDALDRLYVSRDQ